MIIVRVPTHPLFNYSECEELFNRCKKDLDTNESFKDVIKNSDFYSFYDWNKAELIGCIYYYMIGKRLLVSAFANRGHHELNLACFKESLKWYSSDIYAKALHRTSRMCVRRCGFDKLKGNLFIYRRKLWAVKPNHQA